MILEHRDKREKEEAYNREIARLQNLLDAADLFLVEALHERTIDELQDRIFQLQKEILVIEASGNVNWLQNMQEILQTTQNMYDMKTLRQIGYIDRSYTV